MGLGRAFAVLSFLALSEREAGATAGTWVPTAAGTYTWNTPANWSTNPVVPGFFPNGATDQALLTNNITGAVVVSLNQNIALQALTIGDSDNTHSFSIQSTGGSTLTFNGAPSLLDENGSLEDFIHANVNFATQVITSISGTLTITGLTTIGAPAGGILEKTDVGTLNLAGGVRLGNQAATSLRVTNGTVNISGASATFTKPIGNFLAEGIIVSGGTTNFFSKSSSFLTTIDMDGGTINFGSTTAGETTYADFTGFVQVSSSAVAVSSTSMTVGDVNGLSTGMSITGPGLAPGTTISTVDPVTNTITFSPPATGAGSIGSAYQIGVAAANRGGLSISGGTVNFGRSSGTANVTIAADTITLTGGRLNLQNGNGGGTTRITLGLVGGPTAGSSGLPYLNIRGNAYVSVYNDGNANGTVIFDPEIGLFLEDTATFEFHDRTAADDLVQNDTTIAALYSDSVDTRIISGAGSSKLIVNSSGTGVNRDIFNGSVIFSNSTSVLVLNGNGELEIGGTKDNAGSRFEVLNGTLIFSKASTESVHGVGSALVIGDNNAVDVETVQIAGTFAEDIGSFPYANFVDQIYRAVIVTINASGVLDMAGKSEGFNGLSGGAAVGGVPQGKVTNSGTDLSVLSIGDDNGASTWDGVIEGGVGGIELWKTGTGNFTVRSSQTYSGRTLVGRGTMILTGLGTERGTLLNSSLIEVASGATLLVDNKGGFSSANRFADNAKILLNNGTLTIRRPDGTGSVPNGTTIPVVLYEELVGELNVVNGQNVLRIDHSTDGANGSVAQDVRVRLSIDDYVRQAGGQVSVVEDADSGSPNVAGVAVGFFNADNPNLGISQLVIRKAVASISSQYYRGAAADLSTSATSGNPNKKILLGMFGGVGTNNNTNDFMTIETIAGVNYIRPLRASEYRSSNSAVVTGLWDNSVIRSSNVPTAGAGNLAYNSTSDDNLLVNANLTVNILPGGAAAAVGQTTNNNYSPANQLRGHVAFNSWKQTTGTVTIYENNVVHLGTFAGDSLHRPNEATAGSGMMLFTGTSNINGGTLDFGSLEAIIRANSAVNFRSRLTGSGGMSITGGSQVTFMGNNNITGNIYIGQGVTVLARDNAFGPASADKVILGAGSNLGLTDGINVASRELTIGESAVLRTIDRNNSWNDDIVVSSTTETGINTNSVIAVNGDGTLSINGNITGGGQGVNPTYNAVGNRRQLLLQGDGTVSSLSNGVLKLNGELSDYNGEAATNTADRLDIVIRGQNGGAVFRNDFNVFLANVSKINGQLDIRNGFVHIDSDFGGTGDPDASNLPTNNLVIRMKESAGVDTPNGVTGVFMSKEGTQYHTQSIVFGEANTVDFSRHTYALVGGTNTSGTVTYGRPITDINNANFGIGTGTFDIGNDQNTENKNSVGVVAQGTNKIVLANVTGLRVGMPVIMSGTNQTNVVPNGTIIVAINGNEITLSSNVVGPVPDNAVFVFPLRSGVASDNIAEARLYAREGGTVDFKMRFIDDGGDSLTNEVGIVSKIGRGTVIIGNSTAGNGDIDGAFHINGGKLVFQYDNGTNMTKVNTSGTARVPLILAGGELALVQTVSGLNHSENFRGELVIRAGGSTVSATAFAGTLNLNLGSNIATAENPFHMPFRYAGGTVDFVSKGGARINYGILQSGTLPVSTIIPYATAVIDTGFGTPVHDFATLDFDSATVGGVIRIITASEQLLYSNQVGGYTANVAQWGSYSTTGYFSENVDDFGGNGQFFGTMAASYQGVRAIRFAVNNDGTINQGGFDLVLGRNQGGTSAADGGAILINDDVTSATKTIQGGNITSMLLSTYFNAASSPVGDSSGMGNVGGASSAIGTPGGSANATSTDLIVHHYGGGIFELKSNIVNSTATNSAYYGATPLALNFVHAGTGTTHLTGTNTYTGSTYIGGGTVWVSSMTRLGATPAAVDADNIYLNGGRLEFAHDTDRSNGALTLTIESNRGITLGGNAGTIRTTAAGTVVTYGGILRTEDNSLPYYLGASTVNARDTNLGVGDFIKEGAGRLILTNATVATAEFVKTGGWNAYYGLTEVKGGALQLNIGGVANSGILGSNWTTVDGTIVYGGARLDFQMDGTGTGSTQEWITLEDGSTLGTTASHGTGTLNGVITINGTATFDIAAGILRLNDAQGYISGTGAIRKSGAGVLVLSENNTDFSGNLEILQGEVRARSQGTPLGKGTSIVIGDNTSTGVNGTSAGLYLQGRQTNYTSEYSALHNILVRKEVNGSVTQTKEIGVRNVDGTSFVGMNNDRYVFGTSSTSITLEDDVTFAYRDSLASTQLAVPAANPEGSGTTGEYRYLSFAGQIKNAIGDLTRHNITTLVEMSGSGSRRVFATFELQNDNSGWLGDLQVGNATANASAQHIVRFGHNNALTVNNNVSLNNDAKLQLGGKNVTIGNLLTPVGIAAGNGASTNRIVVENASTSEGTLTIVQSSGTTASPASWNALFQDGVTPAVYASSGTAAVYSNKLNIVKSGTGVAVMTQNNTYTGSTSVAVGNLQVGVGDAGKTGTGATTVENGATLSGTGTVDGFYNSTPSYTLSTTANSAVATVTAGTAANLRVGMVINNANFAGGSAMIGGINGNVITFDKLASTSASAAATSVNTVHRIKSGGTLAPGDLGGTGMGSLSIVGELNLDSGSKTLLQLGSNPTRNYTSIGGNLSDLTVGSANYATAITNITNQLKTTVPTTSTDHDYIQVTGAFLATSGSNIEVVNVSGTLSLGNVYNLIDWTTVNFGTFNTGGAIRAGGNLGDLILPTLSGNLMWDTSRFTTEGLLIVVNGVPEPSRVVLLLIAFGATVLRRRRRPAC